jgi:hypothetical protein
MPEWFETIPGRFTMPTVRIEDYMDKSGCDRVVSHGPFGLALGTNGSFPSSVCGVTVE